MKRIGAAISLLVFGLGVFPILQVFLALFTGGLVDLASPVATLSLYGAVAILAWPLGGASSGRSAGAAAAAVAMLAFGVPALLNAAVEARQRALAKGDSPGPPALAEPRIVAILSPYESDRSGKWPLETDCTLYCQRLLYGGGRPAVLMGATPAGGKPASATGLVRYSVQTRPSCPDVPVPAAGALEAEWTVWGSTPTSDSVKAAIGRGRCLVREQGSIAEADLVAMETQPSIQRVIDAREAGGMALYKREFFARDGSGWKRVGQWTERRFGLFAAPLRLIGDADFRPAGREALERTSTHSFFDQGLRPWMAKPS